MFKKKRARRKKRISFIQRFFRTVIAVVILSAFILGLSLLVKNAAHLDPYKAAEMAGPLLERIGISKETAGQVAGSFAERVLKTNIAPSESFKEEVGGLTGKSFKKTGSLSESEGAATSRTVILKTALMADSHNNDENLRKALIAAKAAGVDVVFYLGDYTDFGVKDKLVEAKNIMDESGLLYYSLPGDRDLDINDMPVATHQNYFDVFGQPRVSVTIGDIKFVLLNNSANYTVIDKDIIGQFIEELEGADYVLLAQPLYHPLASYGKPVMGLVKGEVVADVKEQADELLNAIRDSDVKAIFAADQHSFSEYPDEADSGLEHVVLGPITDARAEQKKTSITLLVVYDDGSYSIEEAYLE